MKFTLALLLTVAAVASVCDSSAIKASSRANLVVGYIVPGDRLLHRATIYRTAIANTVQYQDVVYRGNATNRITAVQALEAGPTQWASAYILRGGVGWNNVTIRFTSYRGYGYNYHLDIWGR